MANKDFKIKNGLDMSSPLPVAMGGTGQTSTANSLNALLPVQTDNANKVLKTDGTNTSWVAQATAYQRGGTASRPASPTAGDLYYNTDYNYFENYTANGWFPIAAAPGIPTGVTATNQGTSRAFNNGQMSVAFTPATTGGAPTSFILTPTPATSPTTFTSSTSPIVVTGLSSSTQYTHTVVSTSPYGTSAASSASTGVTATTVPQAPSLVATVLSDTTASIAITAGSTGGSAITGYSITSNPATTTQTTSSSPYTFTGLTTGTAYTFTAYASNALGNSATSSASNSVTPAALGDFEFIAKVNSSGNSQSLTFNSIPQNYTHLQIRGIGAANYSSNDYGNAGVQFNGDGANNYTYHFLRGYWDGSGPNKQNGGSSVGGVPYGLSNIAYLYGGQSLVSPTVIDILDYKNTNKKKTVRALSGLPYLSGRGIIQFGSILWNNTAAINSITLYGSNANWSTETTFALYGIKEA